MFRSMTNLQQFKSDSNTATLRFTSFGPRPLGGIVMAYMLGNFFLLGYFFVNNIPVMAATFTGNNFLSVVVIFLVLNKLQKKDFFSFIAPRCG